MWLCLVVLVVACRIFHLHCKGTFSCDMQTPSCGMWDPVPQPGSNPGPLHWECRALAIGPPEVPKLHSSISDSSAKKDGILIFVQILFHFKPLRLMQEADVIY